MAKCKALTGSAVKGLMTIIMIYNENFKTCAHDLISTLGSEKHFLDYCGRKQQKTTLANKHNLRSSLYMQLTVGIHLKIQ